jgi:hypothetical protein
MVTHHQGRASRRSRTGRTLSAPEVSGRCSPEDCGGPWGYGELLEAIGDPKHERHVELTEWIGNNFDPQVDDAEHLIAEVAALAKTWSRKPIGKRKRRS